MNYNNGVHMQYAPTVGLRYVFRMAVIRTFTPKGRYTFGAYSLIRGYWYC